MAKAPAATDWEIVGPIAAHDDTRDLWRNSTHWLWRIILDDGQITAPDCPTAKRNGTLIRRRNIATIQPTHLVGYDALSQGHLG